MPTMSSKREADEIGGEHQPDLKIAKTDGDVPPVAVGAGTVTTHNPISAYDDEDIPVPPSLPGHHLEGDAGEPTALTHMTAADAAAEAVDAINEAVQEAGILDTQYQHHHVVHHHPTTDGGVTAAAALPPLPDGHLNAVHKSQPTKDRTEFTAEQKLEILAELDSEQPPSIQDLIQKWGVSKSSLHRWKQTVHSSNTTSGMGSLHDLDFDIHMNYDDREDILPPLQEASENTGGGANSTSQRPPQAAANDLDSAASEDTASGMETDSAASTVLVNGQWLCAACKETNDASDDFCCYCSAAHGIYLEDRTIQQQPLPPPAVSGMDGLADEEDSNSGAEVQLNTRQVERGTLKHDSNFGGSLSVFDKFRCGSGSPPTKKMKSYHQDGAEVEIMRSNETEINSIMKQQLMSDGGSRTHQNLRQFDAVYDIDHSSFACDKLRCVLDDLDNPIWVRSPSVDENNPEDDELPPLLEIEVQNNPEVEQPPPLDEIEVQNNPEVEQQPPPALAPLDEIEVQNNPEALSLKETATSTTEVINVDDFNDNQVIVSTAASSKPSSTLSVRKKVSSTTEVINVDDLDDAQAVITSTAAASKPLTTLNVKGRISRTSVTAPNAKLPSTPSMLSIMSKLRRTRLREQNITLEELLIPGNGDMLLPVIPRHKCVDIGRQNSTDRQWDSKRGARRIPGKGGYLDRECLRWNQEHRKDQYVFDFKNMRIDCTLCGEEVISQVNGSYRQQEVHNKKRILDRHATQCQSSCPHCGGSFRDFRESSEMMGKDEAMIAKEWGDHKKERNCGSWMTTFNAMKQRYLLTGSWKAPTKGEIKAARSKEEKAHLNSLKNWVEMSRNEKRRQSYPRHRRQLLSDAFDSDSRGGWFEKIRDGMPDGEYKARPKKS